jgi:hypothetical protein
MVAVTYLVKYLTVNEENRVRTPQRTRKWLIVQWKSAVLRTRR